MPEAITARSPDSRAVAQALPGEAERLVVMAPVPGRQCSVRHYLGHAAALAQRLVNRQGLFEKCFGGAEIVLSGRQPSRTS